MLQAGGKRAQSGRGGGRRRPSPSPSVRPGTRRAPAPRLLPPDRASRSQSCSTWDPPGNDNCLIDHPGQFSTSVSGARGAVGIQQQPAVWSGLDAGDIGRCRRPSRDCACTPPVGPAAAPVLNRRMRWRRAKAPSLRAPPGLSGQLGHCPSRERMYSSRRSQTRRSRRSFCAPATTFSAVPRTAAAETRSVYQ